MSDKPDYKKLRKSFREETSKLDRWLYHGKIENYFEPPENRKAAELKKKLLEEQDKIMEDLDNIVEE